MITDLKGGFFVWIGMFSMALSAYLLIGIKGIGEGKGFEYYREEVPSDPET